MASEILSCLELGKLRCVIISDFCIQILNECSYAPVLPTTTSIESIAYRKISDGTIRYS